MSQFTNNKSLTLTISVIFALILFVPTLLLAANIFSTSDDDRPTSRVSKGDKGAPASPTETRQPPLFSSDNKFLASLRFWEKNKNQPQPHVHSRPPVPPVPPVPPTQTAETTGEKANVSPNILTQTDAPMPQSSPARGVLPEPPPSPFVERETVGFKDAPLPGGPFTNSAYDTDAASQSAKPAMATYSSYSFDTRDWVEFFSSQQEPEEIVQEPIQQATVQQPTVQQAAMQRTAIPQTVPPVTTLRPPMAAPGKHNDNQWDGQATTLVTYIQSPVPTTVPPSVQAPATPAIARIIPVEKPPIDLSPSYQKRLQYTQTCGVVVVQADFPLTELASILGEIEQLQYDLNSYIGVPAPQEKIELCLFKNAESYANFLRDYFPRAPRDRRALYVKLDDKPGTLMVQKAKDFDVDHFEVDLRHEMTHAIIHASIPKVPIWLDEGLAKYFEVPRQERSHNHSYMKAICWNAKLGKVPSLERLVKLETIDDMDTKEYQESWAWTHFLIHRSPKTQRLLAAYLQMLSKWNGSEEEYATTGNTTTRPGGRFFEMTIARGREKQVPIPSLKLYLDDIMTNQREMFREHFGSAEKK